MPHSTLFVMPTVGRSSRTPAKQANPALRGWFYPAAVHEEEGRLWIKPPHSLDGCGSFSKGKKSGNIGHGRLQGASGGFPDLQGLVEDDGT